MEETRPTCLSCGSMMYIIPTDPVWKCHQCSDHNSILFRKTTKLSQPFYPMCQEQNPKNPQNICPTLNRFYTQALEDSDEIKDLSLRVSILESQARNNREKLKNIQNIASEL